MYYSIAVQAEEAVVQPRMWRKKMAAARVKREFRTADEVLAEAAEKPLAAPRQAILDMRGPQVGVPLCLSCCGTWQCWQCQACPSACSPSSNVEPRAHILPLFWKGKMLL